MQPQVWCKISASNDALWQRYRRGPRASLGHRVPLRTAADQNVRQLMRMFPAQPMAWTCSLPHQHTRSPMKASSRTAQGRVPRPPGGHAGTGAELRAGEKERRRARLRHARSAARGLRLPRPALVSRDLLPAMNVLRHEEDFFELTWQYLLKAQARTWSMRRCSSIRRRIPPRRRVRHRDPRHPSRSGARRLGARDQTQLIMCFLRDLTADRRCNATAGAALQRLDRRRRPGFR